MGTSFRTGLFVALCAGAMSCGGRALDMPGAGGAGGDGTIRPGPGGVGGHAAGGSAGGVAGAGGNGTGGAAGAGGNGAGGVAGAGGAGSGGSGSGGSGAGGAPVIWGDGCTAPAGNLTVSQLAVYQSVKIPIMNGGVEIAAAARNAPVVEGRAALFRAFVTVGSGWATRELSARLTLVPAAGAARGYFSRQTIAGSSADSEPSSSFQIVVPGDAVTAGLRYALEIVECGPAPGAAAPARFPVAGDVDLGVRTSGGVRITIIPFNVGGLVPDTTPAALAGYADAIAAMYPVTSVALTVGATLSAASPLNWSGMLDQVRAQRAKDGPAADVYYYGMVRPADSLAAYCGVSCTTGTSFIVNGAWGPLAPAVRCAVGVAFADPKSHQTMAHEIGHAHGRSHAPCSDSPISSLDTAYPYAGGALGSWGWNPRTQAFLDPATTTDIMGYCPDRWISDYTYAALAARVASLNGGTAELVTIPGAARPWRVLIVDEGGTRWGTPIAHASSGQGEPRPATILDATGAPLATVSTYRTEMADIGAASFMVPEPQPGWHAVAVDGAAPIAFR